MMKAVAGIFRDGKVELAEVPKGMLDDTRVIVTFLGEGGIELAERGIDETLARELRTRLDRFAEDWDSPEMDIYNDYVAIKRSDEGDFHVDN